MTPKERYEANKAERKRIEAMDAEIANRHKDIAMLDMLDRFVTAAERVADALNNDAAVLNAFERLASGVERIADALDKERLPLQERQGWLR